MIHKIVSFVVDGGGYLIGWFIFSSVINLIPYTINLWGKMSIKINAPRPKRYKTKVDPIYKITLGFNRDSYFVEKYELRYETNDFAQLLLLLIPYPIELNFFGYHFVSSYFVCKKSEIDFIEEDLKDIYERKHDTATYTTQLRNIEKIKIQNKEDNLNKVFNENYE